MPHATPKKTIENLDKLTDVALLQALIMGEAEAESILGKLAVACVVRNRVGDSRWPNNWKGVMLQESQFSCFLPEYFRPEILERNWRQMAWRESCFAAFGVYNEYVRDVTGGSNHYYATWSEMPYWAKGNEPVMEIGQHRFYRL